MADTVWLDVLPAMSGFAKELAAGASSAAGVAGRQSGDAWSKSFSATASDGGAQKIVDGLTKASVQAQKAVDTETQNIAKARAAQRDAAARVVEAEAKLAKARSGDDAAKAEAAELRLQASRDRLEGATAKTEQAERSLAAASRNRKEVAEQLSAAEKDLATKTGSTGEESKKTTGLFGKLKDSMSGAEGGAGGMAKGLVAVAAAAGVAKGAVDLVKESWEQASESLSSQALTQASLGLTDDQAAIAGKAAGQIYADNWGESVTDTNAAVSAVMGSISELRDASVEDLSAITEQAMGLSQAFDIDVSEAARNAGIWINNGLAKDATEAFDIMTRGLQQVPAALRGEVMDAGHEYAQFFAQLGLDGSQAMKLLVDSSANGQYGIDKMGDALKELTIRSSDMSATSVAAYETAGLSAEDMAGRFLAGGDEAESALSDLVSGLQGIDDPVKQANAAIALFGTPLEDLGTDQIPSFLDSLAGVSTGMGDVSGAAQENVDTLSEVVSPMDSLRRSLTTTISDGLEPFVQPASKVADWAKENPGLIKAVVAAVGILAGALTVAAAALTVAAAAQWAMNSALLASPITWIIVGVTAIVGAFIYLWNNVEPFRNFFIGLWDGIKSGADAVATWFAGPFVDFFVGAWDAITGFFSSAKDVVVGVFDGIRDGISAAIDAIGSVFSWLNDNIIQPVWEAIRTVIAIAVTAVLVAFDIWKAGIEILATPFLWFYEQVILPVWQGIQTAIGTVVDWFTNTVWPAVQAVVTWISDGFSWMRDQISAAWSWVQWNIIQPVIDWFVGAVLPIFVGIRDGLVGAFNAVRDGISAAWQWIQWVIIQPVIDWFIGVVVTNFTFWRDTIVGIFNTVRDGISAAWDWIRYNIVQPVVDWFQGTIVPAFTGFKDNVVGAFEAMRDGIDTAWTAIKGIAAKPVEFVINRVVAPLVETYNDVAGVFGVAAVTVPHFEADYWSGGYTGPGGKYQPAGTVHAGEIVWSQDDISAHGGVQAVESMRLWRGYANGGVVQPVDGYIVSSGYGYRNGPFFGAEMHDGIDMAVPSGTPVKAAASGMVTRAGWNGGYGNYVEINSGSFSTFYGHLSSIIAAAGQEIAAGAVLGLVGSTGASTGPHLHFGAKDANGNSIDPNTVLDGAVSGGSGFFGIIDKIKGLFDVLGELGDNPWIGMVKGAGTSLLDAAIEWVKSKVASMFSFGGSDGNFDNWWSAAVSVAGPEWAQYRDAAFTVAQNESGMDPNAANNWDSNAAAGIPSKGLMQFIEPTFRAHAWPGHSDWMNPVDQILAFFNYATSRYGSPNNVPGVVSARNGGAYVGYDSGGILDPGMTVTVNATGKPEYVLTGEQWGRITALIMATSSLVFGQRVVTVRLTDDQYEEIVDKSSGRSVEIHAESDDELVDAIVDALGGV